MVDKKKLKWEAGLPKIFDLNPEIKKSVEAKLAQKSPEEKKASLEKLEKFISGEMTWAEVKGFPKVLLKELAHLGHSRFKAKDFPQAEAIFKGLSILDHNNWYYRTSLGAIYQRQGLFEEAVDEYSAALLLNEKEITALANRGECYMMMEDFQKALQDFKAVTQMDPEQKNAWGKRAHLLYKKLVSAGHGA